MTLDIMRSLAAARREDEQASVPHDVAPPSAEPAFVEAIRHDIRWRRPRLLPAEVITPGIFRRGPAQTVNFTAVLTQDPACISPFCVDLKRRELIFVETPASADMLTSHAFFYDAQRDLATAIYRVGFDHLLQLKAHFGSAVAACRPIFLHSTGRCGSTLLSQLLDTGCHLRSVSEPDFYTQLAMAARREPHRFAELQALAAAGTTLLCHHLNARQETPRRVLIKLRSFCIFSARLFDLPGQPAANLFLWRDPAATINSFLNAFMGKRAFDRWRGTRADRLFMQLVTRLPRLKQALAATMPLLEEPAWRRFVRRHGFVGYFTANWLAHMLAARSLQVEDGYFSAAIRYAELREAPVHVLEGLQRALELPIEQRLDPAGVTAVMAQDSQRNSRFASRNERLLTPADRGTIECQLAPYAELQRDPLQV